MRTLTKQTVTRYLEELLRENVSVVGMWPLCEAGELKDFGYGTPMRIDYRCGKGRTESVVLHTSSPNEFGHQHMADRAQGLLWAADAYGRLPGHVQPLDVGAVRRNGELISVGDAEEFFLLSEYVEGTSYHKDLERIRDTDTLLELDGQRAEALCTYLAEVHELRGDQPDLYTRRIRELVGHGECIMGLIDSYPPQPDILAALERIEQQCIRWRWKLKGRSHRLRQVHGDFHPWNILFDRGTMFRLLDRSRGEWGDAADDVVCITANYLFFSVQRFGRLQGALETLFQRFWKQYLRETGDREMLEVAAPFFAFRCLVMANPLWYPTLPADVRERLLAMVESALQVDEFDPEATNAYLSR